MSLAPFRHSLLQFTLRLRAKTAQGSAVNMSGPLVKA